MKKFILSIVFGATLCTTTTAQDEKFMKAMEPKVIAVDTVRKTEDLIALSAAFERIADAEKLKWLPYYYAALTQVNAAYFLGQGNMKAEKTDPMADRAEVLLNKADALSPNNSEIYVVKKMIASLRMMGDPMNRYMQYGPIAEEALQTAIKLNPENPRVYLLQAQDKFYTPEQFGGSKTEAKKLFDLSNQKYAAFKPASSIDPNWGKLAVQYFLAELNK
jgi:hypothetical protein